ncbi:hypothetical protein EB796_017421 [Bugula neritina]|uniref:Uncharacterized protein n=1 Tax=Bugula neritina TaxID=10212 RepID=A0A7J7JDK5_BUGNE|nr:hypothetical protein EB796_017421 [Bugula neritina]
MAIESNMDHFNAAAWTLIFIFCAAYSLEVTERFYGFNGLVDFTLINRKPYAELKNITIGEDGVDYVSRNTPKHHSGRRQCDLVHRIPRVRSDLFALHVFTESYHYYHYKHHNHKSYHTTTQKITTNAQTVAKPQTRLITRSTNKIIITTGATTEKDTVKAEIKRSKSGSINGCKKNAILMLTAITLAMVK